MVTNLQLPKSPSALKRVNATDADFNRLETFMTNRTNQLFELRSITGKEEANNSCQRIMNHGRLMHPIGN